MSNQFIAQPGNHNTNNLLFPDMLQPLVYQQSHNSTSPQELPVDALSDKIADKVAPNSKSKQTLEKKLNSERQPRSIFAEHEREWVDGSGVSKQITHLNVYSLEEKKEIAKILGWKGYSHTAGWFCHGVNPITGQEVTNGVGQFKPNETWVDLRTGESSKYLTPKLGYDAVCLNTGDSNYWGNIISDVNIAINLTEGVKKAGSGISHDFPTIALLGVNMGAVKSGTEKKPVYRIVPTLSYFCQPGRVFNLCFDSDIASKIEVRRALRFLAKLLMKQGCTVRVVSWNESEGKGMDDYLLNHGREAFNNEIQKAQLIDKWEEQFEDEVDEERDERQELPKHSGMSLLLKPRVTNLRFNDKIHQWEIYEIGHWNITSNESVIQRVTDDIEELYPEVEFDSAYPSGVAQSLISRLLQKNLPEPPRHLLPFKNGVLNLETKLLLPHSSKYNFDSVIDREHDVNARDWSLISEWMDFVFYGNQQQKHLMLCWYAAVLRQLWELHRFALMVGEGGTGKSTAMQLGSDLVGKLSSHSLTLEALNTNSFQTGNIYNKRLICVNDADRYHGNLGIFKNITGGDEINVEWKFQKAFNAVYRGLVMVSANNPVFTSNYSGIDRRMLQFKFDRKVEKIDTSLAKKLSNQMAAFTNYLLSIPEDEVIETLLYKVDDSGVRVQNELEALLQTNGVAEWLNNKYDYDPSSEIQIGNDRTNLDQLYGQYCDYASKSGSSPLSSKAFSPEVIRLGRGYLIKKKGMHGAMLQGLRRIESGGLIEEIISGKLYSPNNPSYPSYPSCNAPNHSASSVSGMTGQPNDPSLTHHVTEPNAWGMTGHDGSMMGQKTTHHGTQSHTHQELQASQNTHMTGMTGQNQNLRAEEKIIEKEHGNKYFYHRLLASLGDSRSLSKVVMEMSLDQLQENAKEFNADAIAQIKDAANLVWQPQIEQYADYAGEKVVIWEVNQSRDVVVMDEEGNQHKVKRGNLKPWLGI